jgi:hypothetical protein
MNWRAMLLSGVLAAGLSVSWASQASAKNCRRSDGYLTSAYGDYSDRCSQIRDRIDLDRSKIAEIGPTGRHRKALQWYQDDLRNAYGDLDRCRYGDDTARYDREDPYYRTRPSYDPYYESRRAEPYYDNSGSYGPLGAAVDGSFDIKRDWPMLLGLFLNQ